MTYFISSVDFTSRPLSPMASRLMLLRGANDGVSGLLDAEIDYLEAVVRQNNVDQILADVVNVAFHRRKDDSSLLRAGLLFHLRLEIGDGLPSSLRRNRAPTASCILRAPNRSPTVFMPSRRTVLINSSGE
jgi:hypothetical protein